MKKSRAIKVVSALLLLYAFIGFVLLPYILKPQLVKILDRQLTAKSAIGALYFNPFSFKATIEDFSLQDIHTHKDILSFAQLSLNIDPTSLITGTIDINEFSLQKPYVHLVIEKNKELNLAHLLHNSGESKLPKSSTENKSETSLPKIHIGSFAVEEGGFEFDDMSLPTAYHVRFSPISFRLEDIDTAPKVEDGSIGIYAKIGLDGYLDIDAKLHSVVPFAADGAIKLKANQLYEQWRYVRDFLNLEVADGHLSVDGSFHIDQNNLEDMQIKLGEVAIRKLRIKPKNAYKDVLTLGELALYDTAIYPFVQKISIERIVLADLHAKAKRDKEGAIDWERFIQTSFPATQRKKEKTASKPWQISVKKVNVSNISATFTDAVVTPSVTTSLSRLDAEVADFVLGNKDPFRVRTSLRLNDTFVCSDEASIIQKPLQIKTSLKCKDFDITHYNPYIDYYAKRALKRFDLDLHRAVSDISVDVTLQERNATLLAWVNNGNFALRDLELGKKSTNEKLLGWNIFKVTNLQYESEKNRASVEDIVLKNAQVDLKRYKNKKLNIAALVEPKLSRSTQKREKTAASPLSFVIKKVHIDNAAADFMDAALQKQTKIRLHHIGIILQNISSDPKSFIDYRLQAALNATGSIRTQGKVRREPLRAASRFAMKNIALADFTPYVEELAYASIADGRLFIKGKALYAPSKRDPDLDLKGDLRLKDFAVAKSGEEQHIFQLSDVGVKDFVIQSAPDRAYVNEVNVNGLYVDAFLDANKTLNFAKLLKPQKKTKKTKNKESNNSKPFPFTIAKIAIANSNALFADYSLPIKFKTEIHELQGAVYAVSNDPNEVSFIDLKGAVDKYGSMKLKGNVQSAKPKEFTDIEMHFRNLDMSALSGYTAEFAGYKIKNGKLFVDLKYKIEHSQMLGENALLIKDIELGEEIEDENITHLPLGLAIALLEDSDGVIDIEMPVEGNVDAPDFKYGRVILKALANLIVKAVSSPFKFLGSALGINAEELETLEFEYGSAALLPSEREKLDKMATILAKRPKIAFNFTPAYDEVKDAYALKLHALVAKLLKESKIKSDKDLQNALSIDLLEEVYLQAHKEETLKKMQKKLQKAYKDENLYRVKYREALLQACVAQQPLAKAALIELAKARYKAVLGYLVEQKGVASLRLSAKDVAATASEDGKFAAMKVDITVSK